MGGGKVCKAGHAYAGYLTDCPYCVTQPVTNVTQPVTPIKHCPTCRCSKVYGTNAARQRAYRQRKVKVR